MKWIADQKHDRPFPELLAAYADGELDAAGRAYVKAWLAEHPEAQADFEAQQNLSRHNQLLWQSCRSPVPNEAIWTQLFGRVQVAVSASGQPAAAKRGRFRFWGPLASAAAVLLAITLLRPTNPGPAPIRTSTEESWAVATLDDVEIVGMQDADADRLVIGRPPLSAPIVLATSNDITFEKVAADTDGMMPQMPPPGANVPMIVAPVGNH